MKMIKSNPTSKLISKFTLALMSLSMISSIGHASPSASTILEGTPGHHELLMTPIAAYQEPQVLYLFRCVLTYRSETANAYGEIRQSVRLHAIGDRDGFYAQFKLPSNSTSVYHVVELRYYKPSPGIRRIIGKDVEELHVKFRSDHDWIETTVSPLTKRQKVYTGATEIEGDGFVLDHVSQLGLDCMKEKEVTAKRKRN